MRRADIDLIFPASPNARYPWMEVRLILDLTRRGPDRPMHIILRHMLGINLANGSGSRQRVTWTSFCYISEQMLWTKTPEYIYVYILFLLRQTLAKRQRRLFVADFLSGRYGDCFDSTIYVQRCRHYVVGIHGESVTSLFLSCALRRHVVGIQSTVITWGWNNNVTAPMCMYRVAQVRTTYIFDGYI